MTSKSGAYVATAPFVALASLVSGVSLGILSSLSFCMCLHSGRQGLHTYGNITIDHGYTSGNDIIKHNDATCERVRHTCELAVKVFSWSSTYYEYCQPCERIEAEGQVLRLYYDLDDNFLETSVASQPKPTESDPLMPSLSKVPGPPKNISSKASESLEIIGPKGDLDAPIFSADLWSENFQNECKAAPLPKNAAAILSSPWTEMHQQAVSEAHSVILMPSEWNKQPLSLANLARAMLDADSKSHKIGLLRHQCWRLAHLGSPGNPCKKEATHIYKKAKWFLVVNQDIQLSINDRESLLKMGYRVANPLEALVMCFALQTLSVKSFGLEKSYKVSAQYSEELKFLFRSSGTSLSVDLMPGARLNKGVDPENYRPLWIKEI